jgi:hypothetical protein
VLSEDFLESVGQFLGDALVDSILLFGREAIELLGPYRIGDLVEVDFQVGRVLPNHSNNRFLNQLPDPHV